MDKLIVDAVIPDGNEKELIDAAISLGFNGLILISSDLNYPKKYAGLRSMKDIKIMFGLLARNTNDFGRAKDFDYTFAFAERKYFESKADYIIDAEKSDRKDSFHYKSTSLNQVHAQLARSAEQTIIFSFANLLDNPKVFGHMHQNSILAKKYSLKTQVFSMAKSVQEMRSKTVLDALKNVLGLK